MKYTIPTHEKMCENITRVLEYATRAELQEGDWYYCAHKFACSLANEYNFSVERIASVIAVLSPGVNWEINKRDTVTIVRGYRAGLGPENLTVSTYGRQKAKAFRLISDDSLVPGSKEFLAVIGKGLKTLSFYGNIADPRAKVPVTIDRHAFRIALGCTEDTTVADKLSLTDKRYRDVAKAYRAVAAERGFTPAELQAITWTVYRARFVADQYIVKPERKKTK